MRPDLWHKPHMEMHQVRYFLAMARSLNFTRAAEECNVTQPSLTRAIQKLEEEFDGPLFRRERSRTHLTDLGREILPHLERTYQAAQAAKVLAREIGKAQVAPLTLGIANTIENDGLDAVLAEIGAGLPGFELALQSGSSEELIELGLNGALDLFIVEVPEDAPDRFEAWSLFEHVYHMITQAGHPLASRDAVTLDDIRDEVWIEYCGDGARALRDAAKTAGFEPTFRHRVDSAVQLRTLLLAGFGSAFLPPPLDRTRLAVAPSRRRRCIPQCRARGDRRAASVCCGRCFRAGVARPRMGRGAVSASMRRRCARHPRVPHEA